MKATQITFLEPNRSQNINIALSRLRMTSEMIRNALWAADDQLLVEESLIILENIIPTQEEMNKVTKFKDKINKFSKAERFVSAISEVDHCRQRISLMLFNSNFEEITEELNSSLSVLEKCQKNGGTPKIQAYGFQLKIFSQLKSLKSCKNEETGEKMSFFEFFVLTTQRQKDSPSNFGTKFVELRKAQQIDVNNLSGKIVNIQKQVQQFEILSKGSKSDKDKFHINMQNFLNDAKEKFSTFKRRMENIIQDGKDLLTLFGEDPGKVKVEDLFSTLNTFWLDFEEIKILLNKRSIAEKKRVERKKKE